MDATCPEPGVSPRADARGELTAGQQARMVRALQQQLAVASAASGQDVVRIETHISIVLLAGGQAYKFKKVLRTPFIDQSSLALRGRACQEELRLNRRLAPELYRGAVPVTGTPDQPALGGVGPIIDWAVQMRAFDPAGLWDRQALQQALQPAQLDDLAQRLVPFQAEAAAAPPGGRLGSPAQVREALVDSLSDLAAADLGTAWQAAVQAVRAWEARQFDRLAPVMAERQAQGRVREGHGDLHLGNVTTIDGRTTVFDGIEFNDDFRWIDVVSEVAFMAMDLHAHGLSRLAHRFVNAWFEASGDYGAVLLLDYHLVHRALVRAKVALLRAGQCAPHGTEAAGHEAGARRYLALALAFSRHETAAAGPALLLTHGFSGSGKSTLTQGLVEAAGAIRIRADLERKRLAGLQPADRSGARPGAALYSTEMTASTYAQLRRWAEPVLDSGRAAILDATFLRREQRDGARALAAARRLPCVILDFAAEPAVLRERLRARALHGGDVSDADERVLAAQRLAAEPLQADEAVAVFRCVAAEQGAAEQGAAAPGPAPEPPTVDWAPLLLRLAAERGWQAVQPQTADPTVPDLSSAAPPPR